MALRSVMSSRIPLVIILGATGTGKTKLGVELAQKFATEIISADSMQVYKGLDVVTAKATAQERELAKHHLVDILEPHQCFTVVDFRNRALKIINNLIDQGKLPTVVGGTVYYIESIVYKILVEDEDDELTLLFDKTRKRRIEENETEIFAKKGDRDILKDNLKDQDPATTSNDETHTPKAAEHDKAKTESQKTSEHNTAADSLSAGDVATKSIGQSEDELKEELKELFVNESKFTNEEVHEKLKKIDPVMAQKHHPNNRRKILRSIEVWLKSGRRHSDVLAEQKSSEGQIRRPDSTIILWLKCEKKILEERLDSRVDAMLKHGLIDELLDFHARHNQHRIQDGNPPDYTKGVFQTLGFKEFHEYLMLTSEERNSENGAKLLQASIDNMKLATRRFARRQNKMIRARFLNHPNRQVPQIYELDTTDVSKWDEIVKNKAIHIIESFINNSICNFEPMESDEIKKCDRNSYNFCDVCQRIFIGDNTYEVHMKSFKHMRALKRKNRFQDNDNISNSDKVTIMDESTTTLTIKSNITDETNQYDDSTTEKITKMSETNLPIISNITDDERKQVD